MQDRKQDTREKIQLGGLVVKAGLSDEATNVLLGLLLEAQATLNGPDGETARRRWARLGAAKFDEEGAGTPTP